MLPPTKVDIADIRSKYHAAEVEEEAKHGTVTGARKIDRQHG